MIANKSKHFFPSGLGEIYQKCLTNEKYKDNIRVDFDLQGGFVRYHGQHMTFYHEAAYDAHMTGVAFVHALKIMEMQQAKTALKLQAQAISQLNKLYPKKAPKGEETQ